MPFATHVLRERGYGGMLTLPTPHELPDRNSLASGGKVFRRDCVYLPVGVAGSVEVWTDSPHDERFRRAR